MSKRSILESEPVAVTLAQDAINERAGNAHWAAYSAALKAGKTAAEAMRDAEAAQGKVNATGLPQMLRITQGLTVLHVAILAIVLLLLAGCGDDGNRDSIRAQRDAQYSQLATADAQGSK